MKLKLQVSEPLRDGLRYGCVILETPPQSRTIVYDGDRYYLKFPYLQFCLAYNEGSGFVFSHLAVTASRRPVTSLRSTVFCDFLPNQDDAGSICLGTFNMHHKTLKELVVATVGAFWQNEFTNEASVCDTELIKWKKQGRPTLYEDILLEDLVPDDLLEYVEGKTLLNAPFLEPAVIKPVGEKKRKGARK